jgi:hypothetical protein
MACQSSSGQGNLSPEVLMIALLWLAVAAPAPERPDVAVLEMVVETGISKGVGKLLSERLMAQIETSGQFRRVLGASDIQEMLDLEQQKVALGCGDSGCLAQIGGALGVPYLLSSSIGRVGSRLMLNIKLLEVEEARVAARRSTVFAHEDALVDGLSLEVSTLLKRAFGAGKAAAPPAPSPPPKVADAPKAKRPYSITGLVLIAGGAAAFLAGAPSHDELLTLRAAYDDARSFPELQTASEALSDGVEGYQTARGLAIALSSIGVLLNGWAYWGAQ